MKSTTRLHTGGMIRHDDPTTCEIKIFSRNDIM
jgi:hypothetical protein